MRHAGIDKSTTGCCDVAEWKAPKFDLLVIAYSNVFYSSYTTSVCQ